MANLSMNADAMNACRVPRRAFSKTTTPVSGVIFNALMTLYRVFLVGFDVNCFASIAYPFFTPEM